MAGLVTEVTGRRVVCIHVEAKIEKADSSNRWIK
jgi:hypothetical protein